MSRRGDYDDEDDRGGRQRDDYDDRGGRDDRDYDRRRPKSGGGFLVASGVITMVVGLIDLILLILIMLNGFNIHSDLNQLERMFGGARGPNVSVLGQLRFVATIQIISGFVGIAVGGLSIAAAIGLFMKRSWGRTLGLIATFVAIALVILEIVRMVGGVFSVQRGVHIAFCIVIVLLTLTMIVLNMIFLFNGNAKRAVR